MDTCLASRQLGRGGEGRGGEGRGGEGRGGEGRGGEGRAVSCKKSQRAVMAYFGTCVPLVFASLCLAPLIPKPAKGCGMVWLRGGCG